MEENQEQNSMNEQNNSSNFNFTTNEIKEETRQTVQNVKDTIKNTDFKKDTAAAKGFFTTFIKDPIGELKKVALDSSNTFLKTAIIILVIWLIAILVSNVFSIASTYLFGIYGSFGRFFKNLLPNLLDILKDLLAPIIAIVALSALVYGFKKEKNKSFSNIASTLVITKIPVVVANIINLLTIFGSGISKITSYISGICSVLSTVLLYFAIKELSDNADEKHEFAKFALIIAIFYAIAFVSSYLGIYL